MFDAIPKDCHPLPAINECIFCERHCFLLISPGKQDEYWAQVWPTMPHDHGQPP
jgi:hypothetical protein